jgi:LPS sulfotransferase NodH
MGGWLPVADEPYDLAGPEHDTIASGPPRRAFVLCSSPRSGSTLLSEALVAVGAGVPIEYLDPTNAMAVCWRRWGCCDLGCYLRCLHRHRTIDGTFGLKAHWYHLTAGAGPDASDEPPLERVAAALTAIAPGLTAVRVQRCDRRRQALSWLRAERTGRWFTLPGQPPPEVPDIPDDEVDRRLARLEREEAAWTELLARLGVEPLVVTYEDLCADRDGVVGAVARHVGCAPTAPVPPPRLVRQS